MMVTKHQIGSGRGVACLVTLRHSVFVVTAIKRKRNVDAYRLHLQRAEDSHPGRTSNASWHTFTSKTKMKQFLKNEFSAVGAYACYINWVK